MEPTPIPIQFNAAVGGEPLVVSISGLPGRIDVLGGYRGAGCGAVGAHAELEDNRIVLTVGSQLKSGCDASLVTYNYSAALLNIADGEYSVEIFHRRNGGEGPQLAAQARVLVR